jgi:hypothetical protein
MLLAACGPSDQASRKSPGELPYPPADIQTCFRDTANLPDKALTVAEVEALWKIDRIRLVAAQRCGARLAAWYEDLREHWQ